MEYKMNNKQYSKCPKCNQDEKYVVHVVKDGKDIEVRLCTKQCMLAKKEKEC